MTFIVSRNTVGGVSVSYSEGGVSVSLSAPADQVSFSDEYVAPELAKDPGPSDPPVAEQGSASEDAGEAGEVTHLAFKCPACGAEFDEQVECTNQHPAEPTLPTEEVLGGAAPQDPTGADSASAISQPSQAASEQEPEQSGSGDGSEVSSTSDGSQAFPGQ